MSTQSSSALIFLIILDLIYYSITKNLYINAAENIQKTPFIFRPSGVIIRYFIMIFGFNYFILQNNTTVYDAFLFGIVIGGIFNGTMYAAFENWSLIGAILDTLWLSVLFSLAFLMFKTYI